jgi:hypothetical protein
MDAPHNLPVKFAEFFADHGLNINDPRFMDWSERGSHSRQAWAFIRAWANWIRLHLDATATEILDFARELAARLGIPFYGG